MPEQDEDNSIVARQGDTYWGLYFNGHDDETIREWFEKKHGYPPEQIITTGGGKLAGPVRRDNANP